MAKVERITIKTSGRTFRAVLDTESAVYPKALMKGTEPEFHKLGRGVQYQFEVTPNQLVKLIDFFQVQSVRLLAKGVTPDEREDGYAIKYDLEKLEKIFAEFQAPTQPAPVEPSSTDAPRSGWPEDQVQTKDLESLLP